MVILDHVIVSILATEISLGHEGGNTEISSTRDCRTARVVKLRR